MACPITEYNYEQRGTNLQLYEMVNTGKWFLSLNNQPSSAVVVPNPSGKNSFKYPAGTLIIDFSKSPGKAPSQNDITWEVSQNIPYTADPKDSGTYYDFTSVWPALPKSYGDYCC